MKTSPGNPSRLSVPQWRPRFVLTLLLAVIISACGGGGGATSPPPAPPPTLSAPDSGADYVFTPDAAATLSWTVPMQNTDSSPLTDLAGYKIYYGSESGNYQTSIQIDNPGIAIYVIEHLTPNTYYFVLTTINSSGVESQFSNEVSKLVL